MSRRLGISLACCVVALTALGISLHWLPVGARQVWRQSENTLQFSELYAGGGARGLVLSAKLTSLHSKRVVMAGYMAPPLKPALDFFVLTRVPLALCPFCASDAQWPEDIVFVRMPPGQTVKPTAAPVQVVGRLDIGTKTDAATGFVSLIRIEAEQVAVVR